MTTSSVARNIIEQRVGGLGVSEPQVRTETNGSGDRLIVVEVPGVSNVDEVRKLVGSTGLLQFIDPKSETLTVGQDITTLLQQGSIGVIFNGGQINAGSVAPDSQNGVLGVSFSLDSQATTDWCAYTTAHVEPARSGGARRQDHHHPEHPERDLPGDHDHHRGDRRRAPSRSGRPSTTSCVTAPCRWASQEVGFDNVPPTLGRGFLTQALFAGGIGLLLVLLFMIGSYRLPGVLASLALVFYTLVNYAVFRIIPVTLTLAGVAAFILSIGMAVDANILIFERMKEEIRAGKTLGPAIEAGFNRAWSSILDSNVSSLLVASWLYWQGTTVVRGFALVLIIGVLISMFSAITVTRTMLRWVVRREWGRRIELYHVER